MESELNSNPTWCSNPWQHPRFLVVLLCHQFVCSQWSWQWNLAIFSKVLESVEVGQRRKRRCHCRLNDSIIPCAMTTLRLQIEPQHFQFCCHHWKKKMKITKRLQSEKSKKKYYCIRISLANETFRLLLRSSSSSGIRSKIVRLML